MSTILDGKRLRDELAQTLKATIQGQKMQLKLAIVQIGDLAESNLYIAKKKEFANSIGIEVIHRKYPENSSSEEIAFDTHDFNADKTIQGIMVQLPIPENMNTGMIVESILPSKDVDGLTATNTKHLFDNEEVFLPATTRGVITLLEHYNIDLMGKRVVIVGQSALVGRPTALALLNRKATVTVCNSNTRDLETVTRSADIIISAVGEPNIITSKHVSKGQTIIDIGTSITSTGETVGDVDFDSVKDIVSAISPVPGGVGPMTVYSLFENLVKAYK